MTPLSIYIHWPFCKSKCPYCDFNSHVREDVDQQRWQKALRKELAYYAERMQGREVISVFFGGGTPSLMPPQTVENLLSDIHHIWPVIRDAEITLEANPTSVEAENFRMLRSAGVNRLSLGIQSLDAADLKVLGRQHSVDEALGALALAAKIFPRYSFDLIYARPHQSMEAWKRELTEALTFAYGHISLYQLTIEEQTAFFNAYKKGLLIMPEENLAADMYEMTQDIMESHDLPAYEVSNHAHPGEESRHNLAYWKGDEYIGIGPGAHGRLHSDGVRIATETIKSPERWIEQVEQQGHGLTEETALTSRQTLEETVMMGMRLHNGIIYDDWQRRTGLVLRDLFNPAIVASLAEQGLIYANDNGVRSTRRGKLLLNRITGALLT